MKKVTAILLNYNRPENYDDLLECLNNQEDIDFNIWIWDSGLNLKSRDGIKIFRDPVNPGLFIRWELARFAPTDYILFIDDDVLLEDNKVVKETIDRLDKYDNDTVVGWKGVHITGDHNNSKHVHSEDVKKDYPVHFCKGNYMLFKNNNLNEYKAFPKEILEIDSRAHGEFWYQLQMGDCERKHRVLSCLSGRLNNSRTRGKGLEHRKEHYNNQSKHLKYVLNSFNNN